MEVKAVSKFVRVSPRKARVVVDLVRGKSVEQAREILAFTNRGIAETVEKTLNSAVANAEHNNHLNASGLVVKKAFVDEGECASAWGPRRQMPSRPPGQRRSNGCCARHWQQRN